MNLGKYIHHLLLENETVIIPGFGAFISNYKPAEISENEIKPPSKEISFTQKIRNNDGLLVGYVSGHEKISHFDALKAIEKERENIIYQLDKGEKVTLEGTGILFYNEKNKIELSPFFDENLLLDSFGLETVSINKPSEEPEKSEEPVIVADISEEIEEKHEEPNSEDETQEPEPVAVQEQKEETPVEEITVPVTELKTKFAKAEYSAVNNERKKRSGLWYLLILIPIIIAGIYVVKTQSGTKDLKSISQEKGITIIETPANQQELTADSLNAAIPEQEVTEGLKADSAGIVATDVEKQKVTDTGSTKFYLVGGSFKEEENAENYLIELKGKGFEPFHLGKRGNFYIVGIGTYKTEAEAVAAKREFTENNVGSGAWILEE